MKRWQRALAYLRLTGPDEPRFREEVRYLYARLKACEDRERRRP